MTTLQLKEVYGTPVYWLPSSVSGLKEVYGSKYLGTKRGWFFPAFFPVQERVLSDLAARVPGIEFSEEVLAHNNLLSKDPELPKDFSFITEPFQHQLEGLLHIYHNLRSGLFYDPGLGKTKIVVDLQRLTQDPMLILCPKVMLYDWQKEFQKHGNVSNTLVIDAATRKKKLALIDEAIETAPAATIITYSSARIYEDKLIKVPYRAIVADESHQMKSPFSKRTVACANLANRAYRRVLLSGTPSLGSPFDMYAQLRFLGKYFCPESWWEFRRKFGRFADEKTAGAVPKILIGYKNTHVMRERVLYVSLKRTKEECLDLPDRQIIDVPFAVSGKQKTLYNQLVKERCDAKGFGYRDMLETFELDQTAGTTLEPHVIADEQITLMGKLDQVSSGFLYKTTQNPGLCNGCDHLYDCTEEDIKPYTKGCKIVKKSNDRVVVPIKKNARLDACKDLLETLLEDETHKVIIWARLKEELKDLAKLAKKLKVDYSLVQGGMSTEAVQEAKDSFNDDPKRRLYIGQVQTGIGITLNSAQYTIYYTLPWSLEHYIQSMDRNYRIGQNSKVTVYRLLGNGTIDNSKANALDHKQDFAKLLTSSSICATCDDYYTRCKPAGIELFDDLCIHDRSQSRQTTHLKVIK